MIRVNKVNKVYTMPPSIVLSFQDIGSLLSLISSLNGLSERQQLLSFLVYKRKHNDKILEEALSHIVYYCIDHPMRRGIDYALQALIICKKESSLPKRLVRFLNLLEEYVEFAKNNNIDNSIYNIIEDGIIFRKPVGR